jgi:predicted DsbA family dithiol-disulfide isomerase
MDERIHLSAIQDDYNKAREFGITGTPAFFINGRPIIGAQPYEEFATLIAEELEAQGVDLSQFNLPSLLPEVSTLTE